MSQAIQPNGVGVATRPTAHSSSRSIPGTVSVPTKRPKTKHKKPEGMPRRPLSAYNFFYKAERIKWLEEQKGKKDNASSSSTCSTNNEESKRSDFLEMGKAISQRWRMLTNEGREPYEKEAKQDLVRYHQEMDAFNMRLVRSYKKPEKSGSLSSHSRAPSLHEVSPSYGPILRSESSGSRNQQESAPSTGVNPLASSLQLPLPLLQQNGSTARPEPPTNTTVFQTLGQQVIAQQLTQERLTELRALLRELEQVLMLQLHLEQHFSRQSPPTDGGIQEACSALLSLVNQLR